MDADSPLDIEARRVQASGILGEARMRRLFDYLAARSALGDSPKEVTIAIEVFGKKADFDVSQDALVRVYMHKLRKTLDEFYSAQNGDDVTPLHIPRGEYRLTLSRKAAPPGPPNAGEHPGDSQPTRRPSISIVLLSCVATAALTLLGVWGLFRLRSPASELDAVRASPPWSAILKDDRPILVVVGDYYLIGETDASMEVKRLIREYTVNSKSDLENYVKQHPDAADRYMDSGLRYLPTSVAFALRDIMPVLGTGRRRVGLSVMSDVTPAILKSSDIVYVGYLSGLGILQQMVFSGSRFTVGDSYDELQDTKTQHNYISQAASQSWGVPQSSGKEASYRDYGFLSSFHGPGGNTIVVITGTRDEGVRQTAEAATRAEKLNELGRLTDIAQPFEALFEVSALDGVNLSGKLLLESQR
jgi:hypothetical protein